MIGRVPIFDISPSVSGGQFPVKAIVGEKIEVSATIFGEGQDLIGANVVLVDPTGGKASFALMHEIWPGSDRWSATITASTVGDWQYYIEAWHHPIATWMQTAKIKTKVPAAKRKALLCPQLIKSSDPTPTPTPILALAPARFNDQPN